jgi:uncharacterized membrane protein
VKLGPRQVKRATVKKAFHTPRGFDRLVNFSDAVVAIAITLLILPLVDTASDVGQMTIDELLQKDGLRLLVFLISFVVIGRFWLSHHRMYENIVDYSTALLWVNLLWLLSIVFLPFPTELIATGRANSATTTLLYIGTMFVTSAAASWQQWIVVHDRELQDPAVRGTLEILPSFTASGLMLVAFIVSALLPHLGLLTLLLLLLLWPAQVMLTRRKK